MIKRVGILGGTFNPIHIGHLTIAQTAQEKFELEKVIFVPSYRPPHRNIANLASAQERFHMVLLGIKNNPNLADVPAIAFSNDLVIAKITPIKNTS